METLAQHRHARSSAQKVRLVADLIRGKKVSPGPGHPDLYQQESCGIRQESTGICHC